MRRSPHVLLLYFAAALCAATAGASAQELPAAEGDIVVVQTEWGFDGKTPARTFTPLSVLVQNNGPDPASGVLRLAKSYGINQRIDADFEQTYYVSGFSSKWVQLTPFVVGDFENWELRWGPKLRSRVDVPTPRIGERATVLFADPEDTSAVGSALRRCDVALFPVSVTGTDSLRGAVLHADPGWQGARVQAFREWLQRGGRVYLVHGANGEYPRFSGELDFLNDPRESFRLGIGRVTRLPFSVRDLDAQTARDLILKDSEEQGASQPALDDRLPAIQRGVQMPVWTEFDEFILRDLRSLTKFRRNWWLVYACAALYVLAVFPGSYLLGRRVADWRWFYAGFLGIALVFSAGFAKLGELGSADRSRTRSVAVAYQLSNGTYDVVQWMCAASRNGDLYQLSNAGSGRLYTSCQEIEPVKGVVRLQDGTFELDLPSASTCNIMQRMRIAGPMLDVQVPELRVDDQGLRELKATFSASLYDRAMIACAWYRRTIYELEVDRNGVRLGRDRESAGTFLNTVGVVPFGTPGRFNQWGYYYDEPVSTTEAFHQLMHQAVGETLSLPRMATANEVALDPSFVRLLLYAPLPDEFRLAGDQFPDQQGFVLYVIDVPVDNAPP